MNSSQLIERLNTFYDKLRIDKKYSFLITGSWGIGKTYTYNEFAKSKKNKKYYYSLFGISEIRELEKMIIKDVVFPTVKKLNSSSTQKVFSNIAKGFLESIPQGKEAMKSLMPSSIVEILSLKDLEFSEKSMLCLDDLERCKIPMEDLMGFIERVKHKTNIIVLCNEQEINKESQEIYETYKEKVIDFRYVLSEIEDEVLRGKLSDLDISLNEKREVIEEFRSYGDNNLRTIEKFVILFEELYSELKDIEQVSDKVKLILIKNCFYVICVEDQGLFKEYLKEKNKEELIEDEEKLKFQCYQENFYSAVKDDLPLIIERYFEGDKSVILVIRDRLKSDKWQDVKRLLDSIIFYKENEVERILEKVEEKTVEALDENSVGTQELALFINRYNKLLKKFGKPKNEEFIEELYKISGKLNYDFGLSGSMYIFVSKNQWEDLKKIQDRITEVYTLKLKKEFESNIEEWLERKEFSIILDRIKKIEKIENFDFLRSYFIENISELEYGFISKLIHELRLLPELRGDLKEYIQKLEIDDKVLLMRKEKLLKGFEKRRITETVIARYDGVPEELLKNN